MRENSILSRFLVFTGICILLLVFQSGIAYAAPTTGVLAGGIALNEILIDPNSATNNFDTDGNGTAADPDEFIEIYNLSGSGVDIGGFELWDEGVGNWFTFPASTILGPGNYAVVVRGVQAGGSLPPVSGGNLAFDAGWGSAAINNGGDNVVLYDAGNDEFVQIRYNSDTADNPPSDYSGFSGTATRIGSVENWGDDTDGVSLVRNPAGDTNIVVHNSITGANNASPGDPSFNTYTISGIVTDGTNSLGGVTVTFSHDSHAETTAANGTYSYLVPYGTTTTITPSPNFVKGWNPGQRDVSSVESDVADQNFAALDDGDGANQENGPAGTDPSYDGNGDGMADHIQDNVSSLPSCDGQSYLTLSCPDAFWLENVRAVDNPSPGNAPMVDFPCQFFEFEIKGLTNGGATTLTIYLPAGVSYDTYWRYGPTPDDSQPHWYEFMFDGETGAEISGGVITLHFVDGKRGDDDLIANGIIVDQGGPGATITSIPALGTWGVFILFAFMTGTGFYALRRRRPVNGQISRHLRLS